MPLLVGVVVTGSREEDQNGDAPYPLPFAGITQIRFGGCFSPAAAVAAAGPLALPYGRKDSNTRKETPARGQGRKAPG